MARGLAGHGCNAVRTRQIPLPFEDATETPTDVRARLTTEADVVGAALALGALSVPAISSAESHLAHVAEPFPSYDVERFRCSIFEQQDPLGDAFAVLRTADERREHGATYTPTPIVDAMVDWAAAFAAAGGCRPVRVVDPGVGSARFLLAAARRFPDAELIGIDIDPLATLIARGNLAAAGFARRSQVILGDYRELNLQPTDGKTLFVGNPPYVRHHLLSAKWKEWLSAEGRRLGHSVSQLAGLHVHFFMATVLQAKAGDFGSFITAAEWLDVNYGRLVRRLFLNELGGQSLTVIEPTARTFADAASTAVISTFEIGSRPRSIGVRRIDAVTRVECLAGGPMLDRARLESQPRWSHLTRSATTAPSGFVELGELCRVHRGQVTGANKVWIAGKHSEGLPPGVLLQCVTKARELFQAGSALLDGAPLRNVIDLPVDLSLLNAEDRKAVDRFLMIAKAAGASHGYVAEKRKAWWSVGLREPAPIIATYMARRPPAFVRNLAEARHINIAHGLYPRDPLSPRILDLLAAYLSKATRVEDGRTYAGGLTKFEPREMERLMVPTPELLAEGV